MNDLIGKTIDRYQILEKIGEGGMAVVYKAFDPRLERNVAIKVIQMADDHDTSYLQRFDREAKALARLSHPNIVRLHDYGEYQGRPFLVMEFIAGGTLKNIMGKPVPYQEAARLLLPVVEALDFAHRNQIIHRDLKPANILISESGAVMLSDFGIIKIIQPEGEKGGLTAPGMGIGTPEYMSPEQGQGMTVDPRTDIYSMGVILYELVTGKKPYEANTPMEVLIKHATAPLRRPKEIIPALPDDVEKVIFKALAKQPEYRFQSMSAFAEELRILEKGVGKPAFIKEPQTRVERPGTPPFQPAQPLEEKTLLENRAEPVSRLPEPVFHFPAAPDQSGYQKAPARPGMTTGVPIPPEAKKKKTWLFIIGGIVLLAICAVILAFSSWLIFGSQIVGTFTFSTATKSVQETLIPAIQPTSPTSMPPTEMPTLAPIPSPTIRVVEGPFLPVFASSDEVKVEMDKNPEDRISYLYDVSEKTSNSDTTETYQATLKPDQSVIIFRGWCTTTQEILDQNLSVMDFILTVNGRMISNDVSYSFSYSDSDNNPCHGIAWMIKEWYEGEHEIIASMVINEPLNDGWGDFTPGTYSYFYWVTVTP